MYAIYIIYVRVFWLYLAPMFIPSSTPISLLPLRPPPLTPRTHQSPSQIHDIWFFSFVIWFSLAMAIFATTGLGLPMGTWWGHWWVHNWRQWIILLLNLLVVNSSRVGDGSPQTLLLPTKLSKGPFLCRASAKAAAVSPPLWLSLSKMKSFTAFLGLLALTFFGWSPSFTVLELIWVAAFPGLDK